MKSCSSLDTVAKLQEDKEKASSIVRECQTEIDRLRRVRL